MKSIITLTRKKGFLTILVKTNQENFVTWASEDIPEVIKAMWQMPAAKAILEERFVSLEDALNWLSSEGCGPTCALSSSTGDGGLSYLVKGLQSLDCQCVSTYLGRQEPAYNDDNALDAAVKQTAVWKLFQLVDIISTVPGNIKARDGVMTSQLGVLIVDADGGATLDKQEFKLLTESFLDQSKKAKKQGKKDGREWTGKEYLNKPWGKNHTMVQKATLIARCMVAFHWMCQTHHVQYEGFNDYHGRRQHVVRKKAGKFIHEKMKKRWKKMAKKTGNDYDELEDKGGKKKVKKQKAKNDNRGTRGQLDLKGKTKTPLAKKVQKSKKAKIGGKKGRDSKSEANKDKAKGKHKGGKHGKGKGKKH